MSDFANYRSIFLCKLRVLDDGETFELPDGQTATGPDDVVQQLGPNQYVILPVEVFTNFFDTEALEEDQSKTPPAMFTQPSPVPEPPHFVGIQPTLGSPGAQVQVFGSGLTGIGPDGVDFGGVASQDAHAVSDGEVVCSVPPRPAGGVYVHVTVGFMTAPETFTFMVNP